MDYGPGPAHSTGGETEAYGILARALRPRLHRLHGSARVRKKAYPDLGGGVSGQGMREGAGLLLTQTRVLARVDLASRQEAGSGAH